MFTKHLYIVLSYLTAFFNLCSFRFLNLFQRGDKIYVAGQIAMVPATLQMVSGGVAVQCRLSLRHVACILAAVQTGCTLGRVLVAVCYVTDSALVDDAREEWTRAGLSCRVTKEGRKYFI